MRAYAYIHVAEDHSFLPIFKMSDISPFILGAPGTQVHMSDISPFILSAFGQVHTFCKNNLINGITIQLYSNDDENTPEKEKISITEKYRSYDELTTDTTLSGKINHFMSIKQQFSLHVAVYYDGGEQKTWDWSLRVGGSKFGWNQAIYKE